MNVRLHHMNFSDTPLCNLCNVVGETPIHFFSQCSVTINLWKDLTSFFYPAISLNPLTPRSALLERFDDKDTCLVIKNLILLVFKYYLYKWRNENLNSLLFISQLKSIFNIEKSILSSTAFDEKWGKISRLMQ